METAVDRSSFFDQSKAKHVVGWLWQQFRPGLRSKPRLAVLERVSLGPRQSLTLIEVEGRKLLVAASSDRAAVFCPLDELRCDNTEERQCSCAVELRGCVW